MRIAILTGLSIPTTISLQDYIPPDDPICSKIYHPHPWVTNLAQGLSRIKGNEVHVLTMVGDVNQNRDFLYKKVHYHLVKSTPIPIKTATLFKSNTWKMHKVLNALDPDIVHGQGRGGREGYFAVTSRFPCVITDHGQPDDDYKVMQNQRRNFYHYVKKYKLYRVNKRMKYCTAQNAECISACRRFVDRGNEFLIESVVNDVNFRRHDLSFKNTVLYAGSIQHRKQTLELVKAIEKVEKAELRIASFTTSGKYYEMVKEYIKNNRLDERIQLIGFKNQEELAQEISSCLCMCLPSTWESFGLVLAEAMAVGKPVIASNVGGVPYVVKDGITGLLFEAGNIEQLSEKIRFLINNKDVARVMGKKGREEAFKRWHPDVIAKETMKVYEKVIDDQRGKRKDQRWKRKEF